MHRLSQFIASVLAIGFALTPSPASAWWDLGHMQIASLAFDRLEPSVRTKVGALLELNPDYAAWTQGVPSAEKTRHAFIRAATWADDIKRRTDYIGERDGDLSSKPEASRNIGYIDKLVHGYWHYIDFPFSPDETPLTQPVPPNGLTQIELFSATLRGSASNDVRSYDLVWLIHLVGDAHQPLHATSRFTRLLPQGDDGGNKQRLCSLPCTLKLHGFWDGLLGDKGTVVEVIAAAAQLPAADPNLVGIADPKAWFDESFLLAKQSVYTPAIGDGEGPFTLDETYKAQALEIARKRAALAGARLGNLINAALQ